MPGVRILNLSHPDALVEGLAISGGMAGWNDYGSGVLIQEKGGTVRSCWITGNETNAYLTGCGVYMLGGLVSRCLISDNGSSSIGEVPDQSEGGGWRPDFSGGGVRIDDGLLEYCLIVGNAAHQGGGVYITGGTMLNCTVIQNHASMDGSGGVLHDGGAIYNSIFWGNTAYTNVIAGTGCPDWSGPSAGFSHCCAPIAVGINSQTGDPNFQDPVAQDYRLLMPSSCINQGLFNADWMDDQFDFLGNPRAYGRHVDIGAIQNQSGPTSLMLLR